MNTTELLENMTDRGKFERLANAILGKVNSDYDAVIVFGLNAQDETIRGPNDGFCQVPGKKPAHFVWVQHTTTDRGRLENKWLCEDVEKLGDLLKAGRSVQALKADFPDGVFTLVLSTNQRLPSESLAADVYKRASQLGVWVDIWEQSRYARFLDTDSAGQYLRKTYLGTDAQMLSEELLAELGYKSLEQYRQLQFTDPTAWVSRELEKRIVDEPGTRFFGVKFLVGESGFGKSAAAYRFLVEHLESGRCGIYVPDQVVENSVSIHDAVWQTLSKLCPTLLSEEISKITGVIPDGSQLAMVVDDINQRYCQMLWIDRSSAHPQGPHR